MLVLVVFGAGCQSAATGDDSDEPALRCLCASVAPPADPIGDEPGLLALLLTTRDAVWPELVGLTLAVEDESDLAYFRATISTDSSLEADNADRVFVVSYDPVVFQDPPDSGALSAILAHELGHVSDYTGMTVNEYLEFGLWYGAQDPMESDELADYERATDEAALMRGCADGLGRMRTWIYDHADADVLAEKQRNYYTPDEISRWSEANGSCSSPADAAQARRRRLPRRPGSFTPSRPQSVRLTPVSRLRFRPLR